MADTKLWHPSLIVFLSNTCVMIIELVAGRIVAPYIGVSLYTWTTVIGVILAGMSIGNYFGGRLADRMASRRMLGAQFILAGLASLLVIIMMDVIGRRGIPVAFAMLPLLPRIILIITAVFFIPSLLLGTISPVVVKITLQDLTQTGATIGNIYAASAFGSIIGTFATGFFLIQWFGTRTILFGVGLVLIGIGIWVGQFIRPMPARAAALLALAGILFLPPVQAYVHAGPCLKETNYFCIKVFDQVENGEPVRIMVLDRLVHSMTSIEHPENLAYGYERVYPEVIQYLRSLRPVGEPLNVLIVGGGGYTLPRYLESVYPDFNVDVVEIDPQVTETVYEMFGLERDTQIRSFNVDGRLFFHSLADNQVYDLILMDAVNDLSVPYHLVTLEFDRMVRDHLAPDGIYMINMIDGRQQRFLTANLYTLQQVFDSISLVPSSSEWEMNARTTFQIIASPEVIDPTNLRALDGGDGTREIDQFLVSPERLAALLSSEKAILLTDEYVPVDNLLAPTVEESDHIQ